MSTITGIAKIISLLILMGMLACSSEPTRISDVPVLELEGMSLEKNAAGTDSVVHLSLKYTDGNGDIGLTDADTLPPFDLGSPYNHNLPIKIYYSKSGMFYELKDSVSQEWIVFHERVPVLTPSGKNKTITGIITVHIPANPLNLKPEELKFEVNLIDRALNISNTIETDPIELTH